MAIPLQVPSNLTWLQAKGRVALIAGGQDDADQLINAGYALEEAIRYWEAAKDWQYLQQLSTISVLGAITTSTTFTPATAGNGLGVAVGQTVTGTGITAGTKVSAVSSTGVVTLDTSATNSASVTLTFTYLIASGTSQYYLPPYLKEVYDVRLSTNTRSLAPLTLREYDLLQSDQTATGTPVAYHLFQQANTGIIQLLPANAIADTMTIAYYRRHYIPDEISTGSAISANLDFPLTYQTFLMGVAKMFYLFQKGAEQSRLDFWTNIAERGLNWAKADDEYHANQQQGFTPGSYAEGLPSPNRIPMDEWGN